MMVMVVKQRKYRVYEICNSGYTRGKGDGYGHGELHLAITPPSSTSKPNSGHHTITGCGIRELEYTEVINEHIDSNNSNAKWTERMQREISFGPPPGYRGGDEYGNRLYEQYLSSHFGPASIIRSEGRFISGSTAANNYGAFEGKFYGRDECKCNMCQVFWRQCSDPTLSFGNFNTNHPRDADGN